MRRNSTEVLADKLAKYLQSEVRERTPEPDGRRVLSYREARETVIVLLGIAINRGEDLGFFYAEDRGPHINIVMR